jgi:hypothetical protein
MLRAHIYCTFAVDQDPEFIKQRDHIIGTHTFAFQMEQHNVFLSSTKFLVSFFPKSMFPTALPLRTSNFITGEIGPFD